MRTLAFALLFLAFCASGVAQNVSVVQDNVPNSSPLFYFHQRKVARTTGGLLMVTWNDRNAAGGQVVYATYDDAFQSWSPATTLTTAADRAIQPALAADEMGNIHAVWIQRPTSTARYQVFYGRFNGISWNTPVKISVTDAEPAEEATIEVDSRGYLWAVYNNDGAGIGKEFVLAVKSTNGGTTWSTTPDTLSTGGNLGASIEVGRAAVAAGPNGRLAAAWDNGGTTGAGRETYANLYDGTKWVGETRVTDTAAVHSDHNRYCAIAMDGQSTVYVFYLPDIVAAADTRPRKVLVTKKAWADSWSASVTIPIDSATTGYRDLSAVCDSAGVVHFSYRRDVANDTTGIDEIAYTYSKDGGTTWAPKLVVSRPTRDAGYVTLAGKIRRQYGIDLVWRESRDPFRQDQDTTAVVYANVPYSMITAVENDQLPVRFETLANYPNPFNPSTMVTFDVIQRGAVSLVVYDVLGREVRTLVNDVMDPGAHQVRWDGRNNSYLPATSGVYVARLSTVAGSRTTSMLLLK